METGPHEVRNIFLHLIYNGLPLGAFLGSPVLGDLLTEIEKKGNPGSLSEEHWEEVNLSFSGQDGSLG